MPRSLVAPAATVLVCGVWALLASSNPTLTYHFAPLIAGAAGPVVARLVGGRQSRHDALVMSVVVLAITSTTAVGLWAADAQRGPTFWSDDGALVEALLFGLAGSAYGLRVLTRERAGIFG